MLKKYTKEEFKILTGITENQFNGIEIISSDIDLSDFDYLPDNFKPRFNSNAEFTRLLEIPLGFEITFSNSNEDLMSEYKLCLRDLREIETELVINLSSPNSYLREIDLYNFRQIADINKITVNSPSNIDDMVDIHIGKKLKNLPQIVNINHVYGIKLEGITSLPDNQKIFSRGNLDLPNVKSIGQNVDLNIERALYLNRIKKIDFEISIRCKMLFMKECVSINAKFSPKVTNLIYLIHLKSIDNRFQPICAGSIYLNNLTQLGDCRGFLCLDLWLPNLMNYSEYFRPTCCTILLPNILSLSKKVINPLSSCGLIIVSNDKINKIKKQLGDLPWNLDIINLSMSKNRSRIGIPKDRVFWTQDGCSYLFARINIMSIDIELVELVSETDTEFVVRRLVGDLSKHYTINK